jgi:hypothetical protein
MLVAAKVDGGDMTCLEDLRTAVTGQGRSCVVGSVLAARMTAIFPLWKVLGIDGARVTDGVDDLGERLAALIAVADVDGISGPDPGSTTSPMRSSRRCPTTWL